MKYVWGYKADKATEIHIVPRDNTYGMVEVEFEEGLEPLCNEVASPFIYDEQIDGPGEAGINNAFRRELKAGR